MKQYSFKQLGDVGRLGNQLFQIAWTYAQAKSHNGEPCIIPNWDYKPFFSIPEEFYREAGPKSIDGGREFYQDLDYWNGYNQDIWEMFQPSVEALDRIVDSFGPELFLTLDGACSVHYRRGDYLDNPDHFPTLSDSYYESAMKRVLEKNEDTIFWVFSDGIPFVQKAHMQSEFTKALLDKNQIMYYNGVTTPVAVSKRTAEPLDWVDMFAMSFCKDHIIANSTFSWWSAFLSGPGETFFPSKWFGTHKAVRDIPWRKMIPEEWSECNVDGL